MDLGLHGKIVLVTGASKGLGKATAKAFAHEQARVAIAARSDSLEATAEELTRETGAPVLAVRADLAQAADIERLVSTVVDQLGGIDILVANAGGPPPGNFDALSAGDWEAAIQLTLMSVVRLCQHVIPIMAQRGSGSIVAIESYAVKMPVENLILSNSIRMAVVGLCKSLANELGPQGIRVNLALPGWTATQRVHTLMAHRAQVNGTTAEAEIAKITARVPLRRMGQPEEFARSVVWLASPAASFVHGTCLFVDGGLTQASL